MNVQSLRRLEVWSALQCAGGARLAIVPDASACVATAGVPDTDDKLTLAVPLNGPSTAWLTARRVLRVVGTGGTDDFDEYVIVSTAEGTDDQLLSVVAAPAGIALGTDGGLVAETDGDGVVRYDLELVSLTPAAIITNFVLPALAAAGLTWVAAGTITPTAPVEQLTVSWATPLAVLRQLAEATGTELQLRRTGTTGYAIDFVTQVGSAAPVADVRATKNLLALHRDRDTVPQATRVYPKGADTGDGERATMARATWVVTTTSAATNVIPLADPNAIGGDKPGPIGFDGQLVGAKLRQADGTLTAVTASSASAQTVTLASAIAVTSGDLVQFRDADGHDLTYLDRPDAVTDYGTKAGVLEAADVPVTRNLVVNPVLRTWDVANTGAVPVGYVVVGAPTVSRQTAAPYTALGGQSIKVVATTAGDGVETTPARLSLSSLQPHVSGFAKLWVATGQVRVDLVFSGGSIPAGETRVRPIAPAVASSSVQGAGIELGVAGEDGHALGATFVRLRVTQLGTTAATFYVDGAQVTESAAQQPFFEGAGGTLLWQKANAQLRTGGTPALAYKGTLVDLARLVGAPYVPDAQFVVGGTVRIVEARLGVTAPGGTTRVLQIVRDYRTPGATQVTLSSKFDDLTGTLARPGRFKRFAVDADQKAAPAPPDVAIQVLPSGEVVLTFTGDVTTVGFRFVVLPGVAIADAAAVDATSLVSGRAATVTNAYTLPETGQAFMVSVRAYNRLGIGSDVVAKPGQRPAPALASLPWNAPVASDTAIYYSFAQYDLHTAEVWFYSSEFLADPGAAVSQENVGDVPAGTPLVRGDGALGVSVPLSRPDSYRLTTAVPYDQFGRRGVATTWKTQGANSGGGGGGGATPPNAPTALAVDSTTASAVVLAVTMPATNLPATLRVYRDGLPYGSDVTRTAAAGAVQLVTVSGLAAATSYSFAVSGLGSGGAESATKAGPVTGTTAAGALPTVTITAKRISGTSGISVHVTDAGFPAGTAFTLYTSDDDVTFGQQGTPTTGFDFVFNSVVETWLYVVASCTGYSDATSATAHVPPLSGAGGGL